MTRCHCDSAAGRAPPPTSAVDDKGEAAELPSRQKYFDGSGRVKLRAGAGRTHGRQRPRVGTRGGRCTRRCTRRGDSRRDVPRACAARAFIPQHGTARSCWRPVASTSIAARLHPPRFHPGCGCVARAPEGSAPRGVQYFEARLWQKRACTVNQGGETTWVQPLRSTSRATRKAVAQNANRRAHMLGWAEHPSHCVMVLHPALEKVGTVSMLAGLKEADPE